MRAISPPLINFSDVFRTCVDSISSDDLTNRLNSIIPQLDVAIQDYNKKINTADLFQIQPFLGNNDSIVTGDVNKAELKGLYTSHMVPEKKPARSYYDQLKMSAPLSICPFCGFGTVETLDHYLPKALFPCLSILPNNLVPSCTDCNKKKNTAIATTKQTQCLHPYFDQYHFISEQWLFAEVIETSPATIEFFVTAPTHWTNDDKERVKTHFIDFKLGARFKIQSATELSGLKAELEYDYKISQAQGVKQALQRKSDIYFSLHANWWKTAMYQALANSEWYCEGGFRKVV